MDGSMWIHATRTLFIDKLIHEQNKIGKVIRVSACLTWMAFSEEFLNGGNLRTDSSREPMGVLGT